MNVQTKLLSWVNIHQIFNLVKPTDKTLEENIILAFEKSRRYCENIANEKNIFLIKKKWIYRNFITISLYFMKMEVFAFLVIIIKELILNSIGFLI